MHLAPEEAFAGQLDGLVADEADVAAGARGSDGLHHRFLGADGVDRPVCPEPVREVLHPCDPLVAAFLDDVGRAVLTRELSGRMTFRSADGEETFEAGDAFYTPPGHVPLKHEPGTEAVFFGLAEELRKTEAVMIKNEQAMQAG
jgi:hypothetical protein